MYFTQGAAVGHMYALRSIVLTLGLFLLMFSGPYGFYTISHHVERRASSSVNFGAIRKKTIPLTESFPMEPELVFIDDLAVHHK